MKPPRITTPRVLGFPLLGKELFEQAARKRTYVGRVLYALLLFAAFLVFFHELFARVGHDPASVFGRGKDIFSFLVKVQLVGICLFLPAMMASAIAYEKERETLVLLLLTDLRPWQIVLQKFLGRLIPMFTFLLLAMPLMAIAYAFGGVATESLVGAIWLLFVTCLQVGALTLMFSAWCRTTVQAMMFSYLLGAAFYFIFPIAFPPAIFLENRDTTLGLTMASSILPLMMTWAFLVAAKRSLVNRMSAESKNYLLHFFRLADKFMHDLNRIVAGGRTLIRDKESLPEGEPIAWREMTKRSLGKTVYLFRILVILEIPILLLFVSYFASTTTYDNVRWMNFTVGILWASSALVLLVQSSSLFAAERANQTLDILLTTPITGRDIVRQKVRALRRLVFVLMVPFATLFLLKVFVTGGLGSERFGAFYLIGSMATVFIYLQMLAWVSIWIGLRTRTRIRAVMLSLSVTVAWCIIPVVLVMLPEFLEIHTADNFFYGLLLLPEQLGFGRGDNSVLMLLSPAVTPVSLEFSELEEFSNAQWGLITTPWILILLNTIWHGGILVLFSWLCRRNADHYLGRGKKHSGLSLDEIMKLKKSSIPANHPSTT